MPGKSLIKLLVNGEKKEEKIIRDSYKNGKRTSIELKLLKLKYHQNVSTYLYLMSN
jgi:hypothetical protein